MNNHISLEEKNILNDICIQIIKQEELPTLIEKLKFKSPLNGAKRKRGSCKYLIDLITEEKTDFRIFLTTIKAKYIEDSEGKYIDRSTNKKYKRVIGEPILFKEIFDTLAHEIAHLKYRNHKKCHKNYTQHILIQMLLILKEKGHYETKYLYNDIN